MQTDFTEKDEHERMCNNEKNNIGTTFNYDAFFEYGVRRGTD